VVVSTMREESAENATLQVACGGASMVGMDFGLCRLIDLRMGY
jgi:hypothetical protein